ncbi:MAG: hypothetical protein ACHQ1D_01460 [Nitrososphaerales archaeon]
MKCDLSIIVPGIRTKFFPQIYESCSKLLEKYTWELIFVGPNTPNYFPNIVNVRWIRDFGSPTRCFNLGLSISEGEFCTWTSDDCIHGVEKSLDKAIDLLKNNNINNTAICLQYNEHMGHSNDPFPLEYWTAGYHDALRVKGVLPEWKVFSLPLMKTSLFQSLGGLDCRYQHVNMNLHSLAFYFQKNIGNILISEDLIWRADFVQRDPKQDPVLSSYYDIDLPLFKSEWDVENPQISLPMLDNWKNAESVWSKRFTVNKA